MVDIIKVRTSQVEGGGEGLYAKRDIKKGEIVAFYNGVSHRKYIDNYPGNSSLDTSAPCPRAKGGLGKLRLQDICQH